MYLPDPTAIESIARAAGDAIMAIYRHPFTVTHKIDSSPITEADYAAHQIIVQGLTALTPHIPVLSEESDEQIMAATRSWSHYWLVDPLDGTKEFIARNDEFTVNIALIREGVVQWGLVYAPALHTLWYGGKEFGAWRIKEDQHQAIATHPYQEGSPLRVVTSRSHLSTSTQTYLATLGDIAIVPMGSSLKFCIIAQGEADLYPRLGPTHEWDTAAAHAILEGAGGSVTQLDGSPLIYNKATTLNPWFIAKS